MCTQCGKNAKSALSSPWQPRQYHHVAASFSNFDQQSSQPAAQHFSKFRISRGHHWQTTGRSQAIWPAQRLTARST